MLSKTFYSNGKLLLTAEYLVLDGAKALALPTQYGQNLTAVKISPAHLIWESFDENNLTWFHCKFDLPSLKSNINNDIVITLQNILKEAQKLNPSFLTSSSGFHVKTKLSFPKNWGLGTSSTLINNIAQWANINAFDLLKNSFGGSGYDIACAQNDSPIFYQIQNKIPSIETVDFNPIFRDQLYFIHLNKKQNSRDGIAKYQNFKENTITVIDEISELTHQISISVSLTDFENLLMEHERIISKIIRQKPIQEELFSDYFGQIKSLGAWGGDFILATGNKETPNYFKNKGFKTVIFYQDMIL